MKPSDSEMIELGEELSEAAEEYVRRVTGGFPKADPSRLQRVLSDWDEAMKDRFMSAIEDGQ